MKQTTPHSGLHFNVWFPVAAFVLFIAFIVLFGSCTTPNGCASTHGKVGYGTFKR